MNLEKTCGELRDDGYVRGHPGGYPTDKDPGPSRFNIYDIEEGMRGYTDQKEGPIV